MQRQCGKKNREGKNYKNHKHTGEGKQKKEKQKEKRATYVCEIFCV